MSQIPILPIVHNHTLKRRKVLAFIKKLANERPAQEISEADSSQSSSFLALPGEIRNMIYEYCVDEGVDRVPHPKSSCDSVARNDALNLLLTCRQIHAEARSLMESTVIAYIPVQGVFDRPPSLPFGGTLSLPYDGTLSLLSVQITALQALTSFCNVHFHLHTTYWEANEIIFDLEIGSLYLRLRQALLFFTAASPKIVQGRPHLKRHATVHFDHYFSSWENQTIQRQQAYTLFHLISIMGGDTSTIWEVRYYETTDCGNWSMTTVQHSQRRLNNWNQIVELCRPFKHITPKMEIYGFVLPEGEDIYESTRKITLSSLFWPAGPEYAPWRQQSNEQVPSSPDRGASHSGA